jgi:hypothetical protein
MPIGIADGVIKDILAFLPRALLGLGANNRLCPAAARRHSR